MREIYVDYRNRNDLDEIFYVFGRSFVEIAIIEEMIRTPNNQTFFDAMRSVCMIIHLGTPDAFKKSFFLIDSIFSNCLLVEKLSFDEEKILSQMFFYLVDGRVEGNIPDNVVDEIEIEIHAYWSVKETSLSDVEQRRIVDDVVKRWKPHADKVIKKITAFNK